MNVIEFLNAIKYY